MNCRWNDRQTQPQAREELSRALSVSGLVAAVLAARGFGEGDRARAFLQPRLAQLPDPLLLSGMAAAARRLAAAVAAGEPVWVYTDYDVDGVSSAAVLAEFLAQCGCPHRVFLPRRDREGYGLQPSALREIAAAGGRLLVTADCGITALEAAELAAELDIELIITDHHNPGPALPAAVAVVNPKLEGSAYPDRALAGVGVAWNLALAVRGELRRQGFFRRGGNSEPDLRDLLDLVALGTVADVVPLREVNRVLVYSGLQRMNRAPREGVAALKAVAGVRGELRAGHIGFQLGPRLNAAGRMQGPQPALDLLLARERPLAQRLARELDELNRQRRDEEEAIVAAAVARVEAEDWWPACSSLVLAGADWHPGVIGIVASRLVERYHRPCVVLSVADGVARGSARSVRGLDLYAVLAECAERLTRFGGHAAAAGLEMRAEDIDRFRQHLEQAVRARVDPEQLLPEILIDAWVELAELELPAVRQLTQLEPFGPGNPSPLFAARDVTIGVVRPLGRDGEHLKLRCQQDGQEREAVAWRKAQAWAALQPGQRVDIAFTPQVRSWNGNHTVQLQLEAVRPRD